MTVMEKRHALQTAIATLCSHLHGPGHPARCKGCKELTNPRRWWWPLESARHWIERNRG